MHTIEILSPCCLADHLRERRIPLKMSCGGHGSCRTCRVMLDGEPTLACQTQIEPGRYDLTVPDSAASATSIQIDLTGFADGLSGERPRFRTLSVNVASAESQPNRSNRQRLEAALPPGVSLAPRAFERTAADAIEGELQLTILDEEVCAISSKSVERSGPYVVAVDIGTTTLAAALVDLRNRSLVDGIGRLNAQYAYSEDLVARIAFCHTPELLKEMQELGLKRSLAPLIRQLLKANDVDPRDLLVTTLSGNAPMIHILLGLDPSGMGGWPFNGVDYAPASRPAREHGLPGGKLEFVPARSAYLGGDIVSGLAFIDLENAPDGALFVDLGTNAEMALKFGNRLLCTAVPAGPSFEGGGFPCGVSAIPGAIDRVWDVNGELAYSTIGDKPPIGFCGSGIISFVASAFRARILRKKGRYARRSDTIETRELVGESQRVYPISHDVYLSENDISSFLQAKAAVFSGIVTLCKVADIGLDQIATLHLAGNFGKRVRVEDLVTIGAIPPLPPDKVRVCGNTSLKGAIFASVDHEARARMRRLIDKLEFVELNAQPTFQNDFIDALFLPHLKLDFSTTPATAPTFSTTT